MPMGRRATPFTGVIVAVVFLATAGQAVSDPTPLEVLKSQHGWTPEAVVRGGLDRDREWMMNELLWIVEHAQLPESRVTALRYLEELGDDRVAAALESLSTKLSNRGRADAVRDTAIRLRGRLQPDPSARYEFWIKYLDDEGFTLDDAVEALGDVGDRRAIPALVKLEQEASSPHDPVEPESKREYFRRLGRSGKALTTKIRVALEKIERLNRMSRFEAYSQAALGEPNPAFQDPQTGTCQIKMWGIEQVARLRTPEAQQVLKKVFEDCERRYSALLRAHGGNRNRAHEAANDAGLDVYFSSAYRALKHTGRDVRTERPIVGHELLGRP